MPARRSSPRAELGREGERLARAHLEALGLRVLDANVRTPFGEIDLVAEDARRRDGGPTLVLVEVKARRAALFGAPAEAVTAAKRERLAKAALHLLAERADLARPSVRFDNVAVEMPPHAPPRVTHVADAFAVDTTGPGKSASRRCGPRAERMG